MSDDASFAVLSAPRADAAPPAPAGKAILQAAFVGQPEGVIVARRDASIIYVSDAMRAMLGDEGDICPGVVAEMLFAPESRLPLRLEIRRALGRIGASEPGASVLAYLASGPEREVRVEIVPIVEPVRGVTGVVLRVRSRMEERLREAQASRSDRWAQVGQLALSVAHDLANLLTGITGVAASLAETMQQANAATVMEDLAAIRASADRGTSLVKQLLCFGTRDWETSRDVPVDAAIRDIAALLDRLWRGSAHILLELGAGTACAALDPTVFDQVLLNLALNARDAMLNGGRLTLRSRVSALDSPLSANAIVIPPGDYVVVEAEDTGIGIMPDVLGRIFDPFFTTKRTRGGNGLGLANVLGILRRAGGLITVQSEVGSGTCFRLYLPQAPAVSGAPPGRPDVLADTEADGAGRLVLLVEDEAVVRRMAERMLARRGWTVLSAASGEAALELLAADGRSPSVLVTDLDLPGMDGRAVIQEIRAHSGPVPAVLMSGYGPAGLGPETDVEDIRYLVKPYAPDELAAHVAAAARACHDEGPRHRQKPVAESATRT